MAETSIEWTDAVWNIATGCDRTSPGCDHCYALTMARRLKGMGQPKYQRDGDPRTSGPGFALTLHHDEIDAPFRWRKPRKVFVNSMRLGTSIESDRYAFRADHLRATPAAVRFLSCEPLLGPLPSLDLTGIDWVIVGGESGPGARPMHPEWARDLRDRCVAAGVPFHFKQWGAWTPHGERVGKKAAGRLLDGRTWDEWPSTGCATPIA